jgi:hypothetical protein
MLSSKIIEVRQLRPFTGKNPGPRKTRRGAEKKKRPAKVVGQGPPAQSHQALIIRGNKSVSGSGP